jgi:BCD family chlorophyll transporter-like MFS transporter
VLAYGLVFSIQALLMVLAIWLLNRIDIVEFRNNAKKAIASVFESELD